MMRHIWENTAPTSSSSINHLGQFLPANDIDKPSARYIPHAPGRHVAPEYRRPMLTNRILRGLSPTDFDSIRPFLEFVSLKERSVLQEPQRQIESIDFIESGIVSLTTLATGSIVEAATVDRHGAVGFSVALGGRLSMHRSVVLVAGTALRIGADDLKRCMEERPQIRENVLRYAHSFMIHSAQTALCGLRHDLESRLASWLCLVCDAADRNVLAITHDQLSANLGMRRASVTEALVRFEGQGLIDKMRGALQVRNREMLRQKACCCYGTISKAYHWKDSPAYACE
jgi:CRP-like cAMP-binding protein